MQILTLDLMDGHPIDVVVANDADAHRINEFMRDAIGALEEMYEDPNDYRGMGWVDDRGRP